MRVSFDNLSFGNMLSAMSKTLLPLTRGVLLLSQAMASAGLNNADAEKKLGIAKSGLVSRWLERERRPGLKLAMRLEEELGIPVSAWMSEVEATVEEAGAA